MMSIANDVQGKEALSFEAAISKLEGIVKQLEDEKLELQESTRLFKEGNELTQYCMMLLDNNEKNLAKLIEQEDGFKEQPVALFEEK